MALRMPGVRVRFAPSPTGALHLGGARTALFNYLFARHHGGRFCLRIEDTDRARSTRESEEEIFATMEWLGMKSDETVLRQSERMARYNAVAEELLASGAAYRCTCTSEALQAARQEAESRGGAFRYPGTCRDRERSPAPTESSVIRLRVPPGESVEIDDLVRGKVVFSSDEIDDWILVRSDGSPTYNFTVVVDDSDMGITHVIRGDDHLSNTPKQILCYKALGRPTPVFAHVSMILGADKTRLSKRHGATSVKAFRDEGYLARAMMNYLARLGWAHKDQELFSVDEMIELFDLGEVNPAAAVFNPEKLLWVNAQHLKGLSDEELLRELQNYVKDRHGLEGHAFGTLFTETDLTRRVVSGLKTRSRTLKELLVAAEVYLSPSVQFEAGLEETLKAPEMQARLGEVTTWLKARCEFSAAGLEPACRAWCEEYKQPFGATAQLLRIALTGKKSCPPVFQVLEMLGKERTLDRLAAVAQAPKASGGV